MALKVVDKGLREDFSFKNILWIYSGRRGIHCWVCDPAARDLPNDAREAIVTYLDVKFVSDDDTTHGIFLVQKHSWLPYDSLPLVVTTLYILCVLLY